ncbi:MAG TPA: type II secretion system F family protein [Patescibacteria group bacterium]|jgi:type IV pilus assembly protein PilC|nr:type II secretion system F family protein [Patescibacteria group bacterium]
MPRFGYTALDLDNKPVYGTIDAANRSVVLEMIKKQQLRPVELHEASTQSAGLLKFGKLLKPKVHSKDIVIFTRELSTMVSAGVPILRALTTLQAQTDNSTFKTILGDVVKDVQSGANLGDAFAKHPAAFSDTYVNMVRASEAAGILDDILKRLATQQEKNDSIRKKVKGAMTYPTVLIVMTVGAFFVLMLFVMPKIGKIVKDLSGPDASLPPLTQAMLNISDFLQQRWYVVLGGAAITVFALRRWIKTPTGKITFHEFILRAPIIGPLAKKVAVARFARTFAAMMGAGVNMLEALEVTGRATGNQAYERELTKAAEAVQNGRQLSETLTGNWYFPAIVPQMLAIGEETGQTDKVLVKVADFYEEEVDAAIDSLSSIIEPVMILVMGSMVGLIAASVMGPISDLAKNIKG